jgi:hypothetical protein
MSATPPANGNPHDHVPPTPPGPDATPGAEGKRDSHGRFAKGNGGGPGNPFARQVAALRSALVAAVTPEDIGAVAQELLRQAKEGNLAAAKLLLSYTLGKPAATVDPDTLDLHEWGLWSGQPDPAPEMMAAPGRLGLPVGLTYLRAAMPSVWDDQCRMISDEIHAREAAEQRQAAAREQRRARRAAKTAEKVTAPKPAGPKPNPPVDEQALALLGRLLDLTPPSANGVNGRPHRPGGPSTNGRTDFIR